MQAIKQTAHWWANLHCDRKLGHPLIAPPLKPVKFTIDGIE